ncbi:TolC family protein, partial [Hyphococcus sp.]
DGVRREAEVGVRTTLDVLDAEQEYLDAQVALANAERDARAATYELLASIGAIHLQE